MDAAALVERLERFGGSEPERRAVARSARDLADSGHDLTERWNWWLGSLEAAHGNYARFQVRRWQER
ncbi:hypothetical protein BRD04_04230 [Halobacteriales archaeon QS_9_67_17]|nr:MAG: hypothetical protein BRD04_04230 [Halobacteriales archaeon QS_9_67_17]